MAFVQNLTADQQIEAFYIAYFGAAADSQGFSRWEAKYARLLAHQSPTDALEQIGDAIGHSKEAKALYPFLANQPYNPHSAIERAEATALVNTIYQNLLGVAPPAGDPALAKLVEAFLKELIPISVIVLRIADTATGADLTAMQNKLAVATDFTAATIAANQGFPPTPGYLAEAQLVVSGTTSDPASVTTQEAAITAWIAGGGTGQIYELTTGVDAPGLGAFSAHGIVGGGNLVVGTFGGAHATFTAGDQIIGPSGAVGNTLELSDNGTTGIGNVNAVPATVSNIQIVDVYSTETVDINTTAASIQGFSGLLQLNVTSVSLSAADMITAAATTNVTATDSGTGGVDVNGGLNVVVTESGTGNVTVGDTTLSAGSISVTDTAADSCINIYGGVGVGSTAGTAAVYVQAAGDYVNIGEGVAGEQPTGTVFVTNTASTAYDGIVNDSNTGVSILGGTAVTVTTNAGGVSIGEDTVSPFAGEDPTGNVSVTDTATGLAVCGDIDVYGGANVNISAVAGSIFVGAGSAASDATGNVTIVENGVNTGYQYDNQIEVNGGVNIAITTTGASGGIDVGSAAPVTGTVSIIDTYSGQYHDDISVMGGTTVTITENATELSDKSFNTVGDGSGGAAVTTAAGLANDASGAVVINNSSTFGSDTVYGGGGFAVYTDGSASVSVTGGFDSTDYITDAQSQIAGGVSTLASISLTGVVSSTVDITANALASLSLTNSDADVNLANGAASTGLTVSLSASDVSLNIDNTAALTGLTLNLSNGSDLSVDDEGSTVGGTVTIHATGTENQSVSLDTPVATGLVISNTAYLDANASDNADLATVTTSGAGPLDLRLSGDTSLTTITVGNSGFVNLFDVSGDTALTAINASAAGSVEVTLDGDNASFTGGSGPSTVTLVDITGLAHLINGGTSGDNEVILTNIAGDYTGFLGGPIFGSSDLSNFQYLGFDGAIDGTPGASGTYDVSGFTGVDIYGSAGALDLINAGASETLTIAGDIADDITWTLKTDTGANSLNLTLDSATANLTVGAGAGGIETVNIDSTGESNALTLADAEISPATTTINVSGDASLVLTDTDTSLTVLNDSSSGALSFATGSGLSLVTVTDSGSGALTLNSGVYTGLATITDSGSGDLTAFTTGSDAALTTVNAAGSSGAVTVDGMTSTTGVSFTGGAGLLTATGSTHSVTVVDSYTTGSGGGDITLGAGGAGTYVAEEFVNLTASAGIRDTVLALTAPVTGMGTRAIITGFHNYVGGHRGGGDVIDSQADPTIIANDSGGVQGTSGTDKATYTVADGVFTMTVAGAGPGFNELTDVQAIIDANAYTAGIVQIGTTTYVIESGATPATAASDTIIQLNNVTGITGFGPASWDGVATSASSTISSNNGANLSGVTVNNGGTIAGATYNDAGYAVDSLTATTTLATEVNTYDNLANFAALEVNGVTQGEVVVTQVGGAGAELIVVAESAFTLESLTSGGAVLLAADGGAITIDSLVNVDPTVFIAGGNNVTVDAISDAALTKIDASEATGTVTLGTSLAALSQVGLTIAGPTTGALDAYASGHNDTIIVGTGGGIITASGNADTITVGTSSAEVTGVTTIVANGAGDNISASFDGSSLENITANGAGDTIAVSGSSDVSLTANGGTDNIWIGDSSALVGATGNGDTITVDDSTVHLAATPVSSISSATASLGSGDTINVEDSSAHIWAGQNSTINITSGGFADVHLLGDVTGGNSSNFVQTTITGVLGGDLRLHFDSDQSEYWAGGNSEHSQVNVAGAGSLAGALDLAASQAAVLAHQFHGGTGVSELSIAATTGLIDWFQYKGNTYVVEANNTGAAAATHTALGAHDIVVELVGVVDVNHISVAHAVII